MFSLKCFGCGVPETGLEGSYFTRYRKFWFNRKMYLCGKCSFYPTIHQAVIRELCK